MAQMAGLSPAAGAGAGRTGAAPAGRARGWPPASPIPPVSRRMTNPVASSPAAPTAALSSSRLVRPSPLAGAGTGSRSSRPTAPSSTLT